MKKLVLLTIAAAVLMIPTFAAAHVGLGNVLRRKGQLEEAMQAVQEAKRLKGDLSTATDYYDKAIAANSHNPALYNNYGAACTELRQYDKAIALLIKAVALNPQ